MFIMEALAGDVKKICHPSGSKRAGYCGRSRSSGVLPLFSEA
jgi:hypothetical protein